MDLRYPEKKVVLVTGGNGQLGSELRALAQSQDRYEFVFSSRDSLDITVASEVYSAIKKFRPDYVINCAAYTHVDKAETEPELAYLINRQAVGHLIQAIERYGGSLIHLSTDYVYHSISDRPIIESDACEPQSVYALSKRSGELLLEDSDINWINIRVSWLYSSFHHNFVKTMLRLGSEREVLSIVDDQIGSPTYAKDVADLIYKIIDNDDPSCMRTHYNFSNDGVTHWADFARLIFDQCGVSCQVEHISTKDYGAAAPRPLWSVMAKDKIVDSFDIDLINWQESLSSCLSLIRT